MLGKLISGSARNRFLVILLTSVLSVLGVFAMLNTPVDAIPRPF